MTTATMILLLLVIGVIALFVIPAIRRFVISAPVMKIVGRALPTMGDTERIALEAGTVWWDGELFSGKPDWSKLLDFEIKPLSEEEQAFLDGPTQDLCTMLDDWQITQSRDLPPEVWNFIKENGFGILFSGNGPEPVASHLPFILDESAGEQGTLLSHMAGANRQWRHADFAIAKRQRINLDVPDGLHTLRVRLVASDTGVCLVRVRQKVFDDSEE